MKPNTYTIRSCLCPILLLNSPERMDKHQQTQHWVIYHQRTPAHVMIIKPCAHTSYSHSTILGERSLSPSQISLSLIFRTQKTLLPFENAEIASLMLPPAGGAPPGAPELSAGGGDPAPSFPAALGAGGVDAPSLPSALTGVNDSSGRPPGRACPSVFSSLQVYVKHEMRCPIIYGQQLDFRPEKNSLAVRLVYTAVPSKDLGSRAVYYVVPFLRST